MLNQREYTDTISGKIESATNPNYIDYLGRIKKIRTQVTDFEEKSKKANLSESESTDIKKKIIKIKDEIKNNKILYSKINNQKNLISQIDSILTATAKHLHLEK